MFNQFKPTRDAQKSSNPEIEILCDFDALLSKSVGFKFQGKFYKLENVDVGNFMQITLAYRELLQMAQGRAEGVEMIEDEIYIKYFNLIHPLCPEFAYEDLKKLPFVLLNKLITLILKQLAGDPGIYQDSTEKKNPLSQAQHVQ